MALIAELTTPSDEFLLGWTLGQRPDVSVRVERMVVDGDANVTPYFWVEGADLDAFEDVLRDDRSLADVELLEAHDDQRLYRGIWEVDVSMLVNALDDVDATVLEATGHNGDWNHRILFADQGALSRFHDLMRSRDVTFDLERLHTSDSPTEYGKFDVTDDQREALVAAHELGYFRVPREATLQDVADRLGISRNAASARLRRGTDDLVAHTIAHEPTTGDA